MEFVVKLCITQRKQFIIFSEKWFLLREIKMEEKVNSTKALRVLKSKKRVFWLLYNNNRNEIILSFRSKD